MRFTFGTPAAPRAVVEDPESLGYRMVDEPLLTIMSARDWHVLEDAALRGHPGAA